MLNRINRGSLGFNLSSKYESPVKMSKTEEQLILEAAFSAVCDNIMANQMHGNSDMWLQLNVDEKLL